MATANIKLTGIKGISRKITKLLDTPFMRRMLSDIGMFGLKRIKERTLSGEDAQGIDFKPYADQYAKERAKAGFPVKPVDLTRSGSMLSAMTYDTGKEHIDFFFMNTSDPTGAKNPEKAFYLQQDREFFALSKSDIKGMLKIVDKYYNKVIRG